MKTLFNYMLFYMYTEPDFWVKHIAYMLIIRPAIVRAIN